MNDSNIIPVFHPINEQFLYFKPRQLVHKEGDWHRGIQANIIRETDNGSFDILVQERSEHVDIGLDKYDQSLATQMIQEDNFNERQTLKRGLADELNIGKYHCLKLPIKIRIIKTYQEQPEILNQELLSLFLVKVNRNTEIIKSSIKVKRTFWMEWNEFLNFFKHNTKRFTKTARLYFSNPSILSTIDVYSRYLLLKERNRNNRNIIVHIDKYTETPTTHIYKHTQLPTLLNYI